MNLERIANALHPMYHKALELYKLSFPSHEQREALSQRKILEDREYHFSLVYDETVFVGLVLYWETESYIYIEHLCISPEARNRQYGEKVLSVLKDMHKIIILEIDPPVESISKRRKNFYERCGFIENPYQHIHPPYHKGNSGHKLMIMSCPDQISREKYDAFNEYLYNRIMNDVF